MKYGLVVVWAVVLTSLFSCEGKQSEDSSKPKNLGKEELIDRNKDIVVQENQRIEAFISRRNWPMKSSGTGLRYWIMEEGTGDSVRTGDVIAVNYEISLLDGTVCYSSDENKPEHFKVGMDQVESGLHEGVTYLKVGDRARFILPPHLAHGLAGDMNKIPPRSTLIYDIRIVSKS
ncbi:FKBP-type peptidyl-prolyl cis-trans isomerase [bacterium SCSIO 12741]|nr:FKBP-type peptidyl-prolyl cis-trans isomerase [bacterium SCSIO 12741]